jgi:hypothetical protein
MKKSTLKQLSKKIEQEVRKEREEEEGVEPISREQIFGSNISPFSLLEAENELRVHCKNIIDPLVKHQSQISALIKTINLSLMDLKGEIEVGRIFTLDVHQQYQRHKSRDEEPTSFE